MVAVPIAAHRLPPARASLGHSMLAASSAPLATPVQWKNWRDESFPFSRYSLISEDKPRAGTDGALCVGGFQSHSCANPLATNGEAVSPRLTPPANNQAT